MSGSSVLQAIPWSVTSEMCKEEMVLAGSTVPNDTFKLHGLSFQQSFLTIFNCCSHSGERFALLPSRVLTLSPQCIKDIDKAAGWSLPGQV